MATSSARRPPANRISSPSMPDTNAAAGCPASVRSTPARRSDSKKPRLLAGPRCDRAGFDHAVGVEHEGVAGVQSRPGWLSWRAPAKTPTSTPCADTSDTSPPARTIMGLGCPALTISSSTPRSTGVRMASTIVQNRSSSADAARASLTVPTMVPAPAPVPAMARAVWRTWAVSAAATGPVPQTSPIMRAQRPPGRGNRS